MERRRPRAQSDPKAAGAGTESSCLAGVALELTPTQKPGRGPGPRRHTEPLASRPGEKRGFFVSGAAFGPRAWDQTQNVQAGLLRGLRPGLRRRLFPRPSFRGESAAFELGAPRNGRNWSRSARAMLDME